MILSTPGAGSGPVIERLDRMLTEWLCPRTQIGSLEIDTTVEDERQKTWEAVVGIARVQREENNQVLANILWWCLIH